MQEDNPLALGQRAFADQVDHPGYRLSGIDRVEEDAFLLRHHPDSFGHAFGVQVLRTVAQTLEAKLGEPRKAVLGWKPQNTILVDDEAGEKILKLIGNLEDNDDVQTVSHNAEIPESVSI